MQTKESRIKEGEEILKQVDLREDTWLGDVLVCVWVATIVAVFVYFIF